MTGLSSDRASLGNSEGQRGYATGTNDVAAAFHAEKGLWPKFATGIELSRIDREKYHGETRQAGRAD